MEHTPASARAEGRQDLLGPVAYEPPGHPNGCVRPPVGEAHACLPMPSTRPRPTSIAVEARRSRGSPADLLKSAITVVYRSEDDTTVGGAATGGESEVGRIRGRERSDSKPDQREQESYGSEDHRDGGG